MFQISNKSGKEFFYKIVFECLGRSIEVGFTYDEITRVRNNGKALLNRSSDLKHYFNRLQKKFRKLNEDASSATATVPDKFEPPNGEPQISETNSGNSQGCNRQKRVALEENRGA